MNKERIHKCIRMLDAIGNPEKEHQIPEDFERFICTMELGSSSKPKSNSCWDRYASYRKLLIG